MEIGHNTSWVFLIAIGFCFLICKLPRMGKEFSGVFPVFPSFPALGGALWARITKNTDTHGYVLVHSLVCLLVRSHRSLVELAPPCSLHSLRSLSAALTRLLTRLLRSLPHLWDSE